MKKTDFGRKPDATSCAYSSKIDNDSHTKYNYHNEVHSGINSERQQLKVSKSVTKKSKQVDNMIQLSTQINHYTPKNKHRLAS
jgi:uncharacterized membrane protein YgaE (UPF0421/DUF939 family)